MANTTGKEQEQAPIAKQKEGETLELKQNNEATVTRLKEQLAAKDAEIAHLRKNNASIDRLEERVEVQKRQISHLKHAVKEKDKEIVKLKESLGAREIRDVEHQIPVQHTVTNTNSNNLQKFEHRHDVESPVAKKRLRVVVESLDQFQADHHHPSPLVLDAVPSSSDPYQRFELCNVINAVIELKCFVLVNHDGGSIVLDGRQIQPGGHIGVALKKKRHRFDILYEKHSPHDREFCTFSEGEKIYLQDSFGERVRIFPTPDQIIDDLAVFNVRNPLITVNKRLNKDPDFRGFEFMNAQTRRLRLKNCYFKNKKGTLEVAVPYKALPKRGVIRLIVTDNPSHPELKKNDLTVPSSQLPQSGASDDVLYLCDQFGNELHLCDLN